MNAPCKGLLKVISILFIIFGAVATVISFIGLLYSTKMLTDYSISGGLVGIVIVTMILLLVVGVLDLILGIVGLKKCGDPTKGGFFITIGIILGALSLVSLIVSITGGTLDVTSMGVLTGMLTFISFVLPIFYIIGGAMNKKAVPPVA